MSHPAVVRFAPSPTGPPHLGNLRTALFDWLLAKASGGRFIIRIDDTDQSRYSTSAEADMLDALRWLGLDWDEGPDKGGPHAPYRQSERLELYRTAADKLVQQGAAFQPENEPEIIRLKTPSEGSVSFEDLLRGNMSYDYQHVPQNPVLIKSDGFPTYHLATVVDDGTMGITHILRGAEWIPSTPIHLQIMEALGYKRPVFVHLPLVTDMEGVKFSKRDPRSQFSTYREQGYLPEALVNTLALIGWNPGSEQEVFSPEALITAFDITRINKSHAALDPDRLRWFNRQHIARLLEENPSTLYDRLFPLLREAYPEAETRNEAWLMELIRVYGDEMTLLTDLIEPVAPLFRFDPDNITSEAREALAGETAGVTLQTLTDLLRGEDELTFASSGEIFKTLRDTLKKAHGWGGRAVMFPARAALTGTVKGPHLSDIATLLGRDECLRRLKLAQ